MKTLIFDDKECIRCGQCFNEFPEFFVLAEDDRVKLRNGLSNDVDKTHTKQLDDSEISRATLASESCPPHCITVE